MSTLPPIPACPPPPAEGMWAPPEDIPNLDDLVTEDHQPVDRIYSEKQYRLLTRPLYASWQGPGPERPFLVLVNVGWFYKDKAPPVSPDCLLSLDVDCPEDLHVKEGHSYYQWRIGKAPEVVIEIVSDKTGGEETLKKNLYARQGVAYYAIFDPDQILNNQVLRTWELRGRQLEPAEPRFWPQIGLGLTLWEGTFEGHTDTWLRWCDENGAVIPTGEERARKAEDRAETAEDRARKAEDRIRELEEALRRLQGQPPA